MVFTVKLAPKQSIMWVYKLKKCYLKYLFRIFINLYFFKCLNWKFETLEFCMQHFAQCHSSPSFSIFCGCIFIYVWPYSGGKSSKLFFPFLSFPSLLPESFNGSPTGSINLVSAGIFFKSFCPQQ